MNRRTGCMQFSTERVVIAVFPMVRFRVRVGRRAHMLKTRFRQRRLVRRQCALGRPARTEQDNCDERRQNGEGKVTTLSVGQGGPPAKVLTVIYKVRKAI